MHVNNKGFISLYALLLLLIFLCFLAFFLQRVAAFSSVHELQESYDLYAIRSCSRYLDKLQQEQEAEKEISTEELEQEEEIQEAKKLPKQWEQLFRNAVFQFTRHENQIDVVYTHPKGQVHMRVVFDSEDGSILDVVYLGSDEPD